MSLLLRRRRLRIYFQVTPSAPEFGHLTNQHSPEFKQDKILFQVVSRQAVKQIAVDIFNDLDEILFDRGKFVERLPICQECEAILIHLALSLFHFVFQNFLEMVNTEATIIRFTQIF